MMHITDLMPLISALFIFILSLFVWLKNRQARINKTFFYHSLAIITWLFGTFMMFISRASETEAVFWDRFVYVGVVFIPVLVYHFGLAYTGKKNDAFLYLGYVLSVFFLIISRTEYFVSGVFTYKWGIHTKAQIFHHIFLVYFVAYVLIWFFKTYKYYRQLKSPIARQQTKYIFLGFLLLFCIGPLAYLPAYGIGIYPFAYIAGLPFTIVISYAIIRHRLMDIKLALRGSSVFLSSVATIVIVAALIKYLADLYFYDYAYWLDLLVLLFGISLFSRIKGYYYKLANKYFFSSLYDSREVIATVSDGLRSTLELKLIYQHVYSALNGAFHARAFAVLKHSVAGGYRTKFNSGFSDAKLAVFKGAKESEKILSQREGIMITEEVDNLYEGINKDLVNVFRDLKIAVIAPLKIKDKVVGILLFGPKESGDIYNQEDIRTLEVVCVQAAIAIENALLYEEILSFNKKLKVEVEKATIDLRAANSKLKQLDEAKSEFVSIASHQLRTPLTIIKGYISMMLEGGFGSFSVGAKDSLKNVYESNERLIHLVENLLNISRIESGRLKFNFEATRLEKLIAGVLEELSGSAESKRLKLVFKKPKKILPLVNIDSEKIRQVIMNLVDNAIKYSQKGRITVSIGLEGETIATSVVDQGMGMRKEDRVNLFDKFSRGSDVSLVHTEGTGLGLYVAKKMINAHRGKIWAESDGEGKGSRFYFTLPVLKA